MSDPVILRASGLRKSYSQASQEIRVLEGLDFELSPRESVAITGRSGSGKSTLLHALAGLDEIDSGTIEVLGVNLTQSNSDERAQIRLNAMGFVYQAHHLLPEFTALENVAMPLRLRGMGGNHTHLHRTYIRTGCYFRLMFMLLSFNIAY